jgi:hypothetical protein
LAEELERYAQRIAADSNRKISYGEIFAKILTPNDDSGRHGVLIPSDVYSFFPDFVIPDVTQNATVKFNGFDSLKRQPVTLAYKYYQRYPERRITRLNGLINERAQGRRLIVFLRLKLDDGDVDYFVDATLESDSTRFAMLTRMLFGPEIQLIPGVFVRKEITAGLFSIDAPLESLLGKFDEVKELGWVDSLRSGDTGIGYTFETMIGVAENNSREADYQGIEIKCKQAKAGNARGGKINLFQQVPEWTRKLSGMERLKLIGKQEIDGTYSCHSQVTALPNNLGLRLDLKEIDQRIDLLKDSEEVGYWLYDVLQKRLLEKHSRAVFIKAKVRNGKDKIQFKYDELIYCERPSIERFVDLVRTRDIVFEFVMAERNGKVRNHGYPWRLGHDELLDSLFGLQIQLRK